ncbi:histidine phosphatase family protein [Ligilactobacillus sp. Marseille-Q7487]|uniref:histidine phosphatase family protein n=1 Tax=Ligilactobacillus sp. Marseille-Q7487 TaxID=3022128 RepID=UPI0024A8AC6C|nr:histidine phosphatase family protein [Ligilactobacillus sp. Marseille-Q7487]
MEKTLYLMRHAKTLFNKMRKIQGWCDSPLTKEGIQQAKKAGVFLADVDFDAAYCSTSERCSDTLELVSALPYTRLKGLKEAFFGAFEGEHEYLNPKRDQLEEFFVSYGGETRSQVQKRMVETLTDIMQDPNNQTVLAVSHAGSSMSFLAKWGDPEIVFERFGRIPNCCIFKYLYDSTTKSFTLLDIYDPTA